MYFPNSKLCQYQEVLRLIKKESAMWAMLCFNPFSQLSFLNKYKKMK
jgi:hypothetical protein